VAEGGRDAGDPAQFDRHDQRRNRDQTRVQGPNDSGSWNGRSEVNRSGHACVGMDERIFGEAAAIQQSQNRRLSGRGMVVVMNGRGGSVIRTALIIIVVVGLAVDAYVHFDLASAFKNNRTSTLSEADLFRAEAVAAVIAAVALLLRPRRVTAALAFLVAAAGTVAVLVYRYVDIAAFGPIPAMYDPYWAPAEKTVSAVAEAVAALAALALLVMFSNRTRSGAPAGRAAVRGPQLNR
jgi:hypothetical protein